MKKILKNTSLIALGILIGSSATISANMEKIEVYKDNITSIFVKGEQKNTTVLNYQNSIYVPLRYISESMDMSVDYDRASRSVRISEKQLSKEERIAKNADIYKEAIAEGKKLQAQTIEQARKEELEKNSQIQYNELPISYKYDNFKMSLIMVVNENSNYNSEFYFDIKNDNEYGIVIDPFSARFNYTGEKRDYEIDIDDVSISDMDGRILNSLDYGFEKTIFMTLNKIPKDVRQGTLSFNIYRVGEENNIKKVIMPIKF